MNIEKLKIKLELLAIDENAYSLEGGLPNERYCIDKEYQVWVVYYSERGERSGLRKFESENRACEYLLELLSNDPTAFRTDYLQKH